MSRRTGVLVGILACVVLVGGLLVVGWFVAEGMLRSTAEDRIRTLVAGAFGADPEQVDVAVGGGAVIPQLLAGSLDRVDIAVDDVELAGVSGSATAVAEGVPTAEGGTIERLVAQVALPSASVRELVARATGLSAEAIEVGDETIAIATELDVVLTKVRLAVELRPSAAGGAIELEPVAVRLGDQRITAEELRAMPLVGDAAGELLATREVCIADSLPAALSLSALDLRAGRIDVVLRGTAIPTTAAALSARGAC